MLESLSSGGSARQGSLKTAESLMAAEVTSNAKAKRYDRQLRIWGLEGQSRLEACKLCLLNCGPTGAETLKNLVLGGIAAFTIVDGQKVTATDLGNNFMVSPDSLGEPRAKVVTKLLNELNDMVASSYVEETPENLIERNPQFFAQFSVVIATQIRETDILKLDSICREHRVTLLVVRSYGLAGMLRPSLPEHLVVESKPDNVVDDLRLFQPFPALQEYANSYNLSELDQTTLNHMPYVVLLIKAVQAWKTSTGSLPSTSKDKQAFKRSIRQLKKSEDDMGLDASSFEQAEKAAFHVWTEYSLGADITAILADECGSDAAMTSSTPDFWVLVNALRRFKEHEGGGTYLPLDGAIPDMHATTELFLQLQRVYRDKAEQDIAAMEAHVAAILSSVSRDKQAIGRDTIRQFCKNARHLHLQRYKAITHEYSSSGGSIADVLSTALTSEGKASSAALYLLIRAADRFHTLHGRFPGTAPEVVLEEDLPGLKAIAHQLLTEMGVPSANIPDDYILEVVRFGASELHVVAAFMGGLAAQEVIKLVTRQFTPVAGTLVFNGIASTTATFKW